MAEEQEKLSDLCAQHKFEIKVEHVRTGFAPDEPIARVRGGYNPNTPAVKHYRREFKVELFLDGKSYGPAISYTMGCPLPPTGKQSVYDRGIAVREHAKEVEKRVPTVTDVVGCLLCDASCYNGARSFEDFCSEFDYSTDSIRARETYMACGEANKNLRALLGPLFDRFAAAEY